MNTRLAVCRAVRTPVALLTMNLVLAACGGGGGGGGFAGFPVAPAPAPASAAQTPPPAPAPAAASITTQPSNTTVGQGVPATLKVQAAHATAYQLSLIHI